MQRRHIEIKQRHKRFSILNPEFRETNWEVAKARKRKIEALLYYDKLLIDHREKSFSNSAIDKSQTY